MATILDKIVEQTKVDIKNRKKTVHLSDFNSFELFEKKQISFAEALKFKNDKVQILAEIKKASPSKGLIRADFNPEKIAESYIKAGASAISVLTEEAFFQGSLSYLDAVSRMSPIPLLRKDFIINPYQVFEAKAYGADAILLIATICSEAQLNELHAAADEIGLDCLVELYHKDEWEKVDKNQVKIIGVNNRDLNTFDVDLHRGVAILEELPSDLIKVSESGLSKAQDIAYLHNHSIDAALIGEHFMRYDMPEDGIKEILEYEVHLEEN